MGFRMRRSIKLGKGARINLSKSGPSLSLGKKGFTHNISKRGQKTTVGLPGSGISYEVNHKRSKKSENAVDEEASVWDAILGIAILGLIGFGIFHLVT